MDCSKRATHTTTSNALDASVAAGERLWTAMVDAWTEKLNALTWTYPLYRSPNR